MSSLPACDVLQSPASGVTAQGFGAVLTLTYLLYELSSPFSTTEGCTGAGGALKCHINAQALQWSMLGGKGYIFGNWELLFSGGAATTRQCAGEQHEAVSCGVAVEYNSSVTKLFY